MSFFQSFKIMHYFLILNGLYKSKQKQFYGHRSNKTRKSTLLRIGNFKENIELSHIYLALTASCQKVPKFGFPVNFVIQKPSKSFSIFFLTAILSGLRNCFFFFFFARTHFVFLNGVFLYFQISYLIYEFLYDVIIMMQ